MNADASGLAHDLVRQRSAQQAFEPTRPRPADDDLRDVLPECEAVYFARQIASAQPRRFSAQSLRQRQRVVDPFERIRVMRLARRNREMDRDPARIQSSRQARRDPHNSLRLGVGADADEQALGRRPWPFDGVLAQKTHHLIVDPLGRAPQRKLSQCSQIAWLQEVLFRPFGIFRQIDLSLLEPLDEFVRSDVDDYDIVGLLDDRVRNEFADFDSGNGGNHIGQALHMLDVHRRPDMDAGLEQLLDILIALGMTAVGCIGMGQFVDDDQRRTSLERSIDVELLAACGPCRRSLCAGAPRDRRAGQPSRRGRGSPRCRLRRRGPRPSGAARPTASRRSCRRRAKRRETP